MSGNDGREVTPVPIPNTEVKLSSADGSWDLVPVRVGRCQAILFRSSSAVELSAVNRSVVGSIPTCGAIGELSELKEHDWKSCIRHKRIKGSNPLLSAIGFIIFYRWSSG